MNLGDLRRVGRAATLTGIGGVVLPFILGAAWASFSGMNTPKALFIASAFVATSAGITARVLAETRKVGADAIAAATTQNFFRLFSKVPA